MLTKKEMERLKELIKKTDEEQIKQIVADAINHSCDTLGMPAYWWE